MTEIPPQHFQAQLDFWRRTYLRRVRESWFREQRGRQDAAAYRAWALGWPADEPGQQSDGGGQLFGYYGDSFPTMASAEQGTPAEDPLARARRERDEARREAQDWERRFRLAEASAELSERRREALADVASRFRPEPGAGWARSVYVALDDLNGWARLARSPW